MIPVARPCTGQEEIDAVRRVLGSGMLAQGRVTKGFEEKFAAYCGVKHAVAVNNGTAALHATLLAAGIGPGDEVIVPAFTFYATASSVSMCGARPVFADVDRKTFTLDPASVQENINPRTKAVTGVHLFGQSFDIRPILDTCEEKGIFLIEDAAQAHGSEYKDKRVGGIADAACFSFYPTKNMTTGEGGMVTTNDDRIAERVRLIINHGQSEKYRHTVLGYNYRMTDIGAGIGLAQLAKLESFNRKRQENAHHYDRTISRTGIVRPAVASYSRHVYHQYAILVEGSPGRDGLAKILGEHGIGSAIHYPIPLHRQPVYEGITKDCSCPVTEYLCDHILSIPVHPGISGEQREYISATINGVN